MAKRFDYGTAWPVLEFWDNKIEKHMDVVRAYIEPIVQNALEKKKRSNVHEIDDDEEEVTLLEHLVKMTDGQQQNSLYELSADPTLDATLIRDEAHNVMVAARDTVRFLLFTHASADFSQQTASTLTFVMGLLAQHPEVLARLREEVLAKFGTSKTPTYDDLRDMKYLRAVINGLWTNFPVAFYLLTRCCRNTALVSTRVS